MKEELCRACNLCGENASLTKLLEHWVPPERPEKDDDDKRKYHNSEEDKRRSEMALNNRTTADFAGAATNRGMSEKPAAEPVDALGAALSAKLKARAEGQAREATA